MTKSNLRKICAAIGVTALTTTKILAGTFVVTTTADSGCGSLREAILSANASCGGQITFFKVNGTIELLSPLPAIAQNTYIIGPGCSTVTVSGGGANSIFSATSGTAGLISGLTIANGSATGNPGPFSKPVQASGFANAGHFELRNCVIQNCKNFFSDGAAVYNSGTLQIIQCTVENCGSSEDDADVLGGAVFNTGSLTMGECTVSNCIASEGGGVYNTGTSVLYKCSIVNGSVDYNEGDAAGIYNKEGSCTLESCTVSNCNAGFDGGAIVSYADLTARDTVINDNTALEGGGVYLGGGTNSFHNCTISSNTGFEFGGGGIKNLATLTLTRCTVSGNSSQFAGGGGIENLGSLVMTNCTVEGNSCTDPDGAGILNLTTDWDGTTYSNNLLQITASTIASNTASGVNNNGGSVEMEMSIVADNGGVDYSGGLVSQGYNLILNTGSANISGNTTGNIYGEDPMLGPLQNNGGHTFTMSLLPGSPAIGAGITNGPPFFDQRGVPRPQGSAGDIGAFEGIGNNAHFLTLTPMGNGVQLGLNGTPGLSYTIQRASSPNGPWTTFTNITTGQNGAGVCVDGCQSSRMGFYRSVYP